MAVIAELTRPNCARQVTGLLGVSVSPAEFAAVEKVLEYIRHLVVGLIKRRLQLVVGRDEFCFKFLERVASCQRKPGRHVTTGRPLKIQPRVGREKLRGGSVFRGERLPLVGTEPELRVEVCVIGKMWGDNQPCGKGCPPVPGAEARNKTPALRCLRAAACDSPLLRSLYQASPRTAGERANHIYNSHSASFVPSAVRVNIEAVYSVRREADLVMTSIGKVQSSTLSFRSAKRAHDGRH